MVGPLELVGVSAELSGGGGGDSRLEWPSLVWDIVDVADDMEFVRFGGWTIIVDWIVDGIVSLVNMEWLKAVRRFCEGK